VSDKVCPVDEAAESFVVAWLLREMMYRRITLACSRWLGVAGAIERGVSQCRELGLAPV